MPGTYLNFPFDAEIFLMQWRNAPDPVKLAMLNSGAIQPNSQIKSLIANGSNVYTIPFYNIIGGNPDNYDGATNITVNEVTGGSQSGVVWGRAHAWRDRDFVHDFNSKADPTQQIASQVSRYWQKKRQATVLALLQGIFGITGSTGYAAEWLKHTYNIASQNGAAVSADTKMGATTLGDALQQSVGDNADIFSLVWMHSFVANGLAGLQLLSYRKYTDAMGIERQLKIADFNGCTVIIDDDCPTRAAGSGYYAAASTDTGALKVVADTATPDTGEIKLGTVKAAAFYPANVAANDYVVANKKEYITYALGMGAIFQAPAPVKVPVEVHREPKDDGGYDELITRFRETYHPNGFTFTIPTTSPVTISPTDAQLGAAANWSVVTDPKAIPIARIISNG